MLRLLSEKGGEDFIKTLLAPDWTFVPDQWEVQMWTKLFKITPPENLIYCCFEIPREDFAWIPGVDGRAVAPEAKTLKELTESCLRQARDRLRRRLNREPEIAVLPDGPYGIPVAS
jgi:hypothetical protein